MGIEILDQVGKVDAIIVPVGGCGLIAGVSMAVKTLSPSTWVREEEGGGAGMGWYLHYYDVVGCILDIIRDVDAVPCVGQCPR